MLINVALLWPFVYAMTPMLRLTLLLFEGEHKNTELHAAGDAEDKKNVFWIQYSIWIV